MVTTDTAATLRAMDLVIVDLGLPDMDGSEVIERIRALLRRNEASRAEGSGASPSGVMTRGDLVLDETKHQCVWRGKAVQLTVTESGATESHHGCVKDFYDSLFKAGSKLGTTAPLDADLEVTGPIVLKLFASSTAIDTQFIVKIADQHPQDEAARNKGDQPAFTPASKGWLKASHREKDEKRSTKLRPFYAHANPQPLKPGEVVPLDIELWPTSIVVPAGYRIAMGSPVVGTGKLDWARILPAAYRAGARHFLVEQEPKGSDTPMEAAAKSFAYLSGLRA